MGRKCTKESRGRLWKANFGDFNRFGVWGGGFESTGPACKFATQLPFFDPCLKGNGKTAFRVKDLHSNPEMAGTILGGDQNLHADIDVVLKRMRDRKREKMARTIPPAPPNSLRSLRTYVLQRKFLGRGRKRTIFTGNGGEPWDVDAWRIV
jgi:hypothetical protein